MSSSFALASAAYVTSQAGYSGCSEPMPDGIILGTFLAMCVGFLSAAYGAIYAERDYDSGRGTNALLYGAGGTCIALVVAIFIGLAMEVFT